MSMPERNLDLVVIAKDSDRDDSMNYALSAIPAGEIDFSIFIRPEQMTAYEFDAYDTLGDDECERQEIDTLYDLFGTEWAERFYRRKNHLLATVRVQDLYLERDELNASIAAWEAKL